MGLGGIVNGKKTTLRPPTEDDLVPIAGWMADMRVRHLTRVWHEPAMPATWKERFTEQTKDKNNVLWAIDAESRLVGIVRAGFGREPRRDSAHIDQFIVDPDMWRKGYGFDVALALHRYFFDYLDLRRVSVNFTSENVGGRRIAERIGYTPFAEKHQVHYRDGAYVDELELLVERPAWDERWGAEREYQPLETS
ncbi:MAG: GNAT family N-acetyltransferase [Candidatus Limnocylindria bacterium]|nr:GNAT family N-acetyltransferase [Candidatus Limnocylindria bacterium]